MKTIMMGAAVLALTATSAFATNEDRVRAGNETVTLCWYNDAGNFTAARGEADIPFEVKKGIANSRNAWSYGVPGGADSCPKKLPRH